jgi:hypothetical protein
MAGHSHWANIQHKKGIADAKRGKLWSKLSRAIIIAAKNGGGDPAMNLKLRYAIDKARQVSMPRDNIERAIKRGTGEGNTEVFDEITYEGFGPGGVAVRWRGPQAVREGRRQHGRAGLRRLPVRAQGADHRQRRRRRGGRPDGGRPGRRRRRPVPPGRRL